MTKKLFWLGLQKELKTIKCTAMKKLKIVIVLAFLVSWCIVPAVAQEDESTEIEEENKPTRPHFESAWLIDNQSVVLPRKKTFEFVIQHRFGLVNSGLKDMWGLYLPSNIRLGLSYTLFDNIGFGSFKGPIAIGIGSTKDNRVQDINIKYGMLQQTRNNRIPLSVTYYGNTAFETLLKTDELPNGNESDRQSYFHQLIISRRFSSKVSIQVAPSISHYNVVNPYMNNDHIAVAVGGRFKFSAQSSVLINVDQPITEHKLYNPHPNVSFGIEIGTSAHAFQIFATNYQSIVPQRNNVTNQNDPWDEGFLIGFNITRLWGF